MFSVKQLAYTANVYVIATTNNIAVVNIWCRVEVALR